MRKRFGHGKPARWLAVVLVLTGCDATNDTARSHLVAQWQFDEGTGKTAADASGHGNTASIRGGSWAEGHVGQALLMPGGNDGIVTVPLSDSLRTTADQITVMAWTYRTAQHNVAVVSHGYPTLFFGFHGSQFKWEIEHANGRITECYANPKFVAGLDRWIHLAATYNGWIARLYADGVEVCSRWTWGALQMPDTPFTISGYLNDSGQIVDEITGRIDDVRIYNRALSAQQIRDVAEGVHGSARE
jgi:hypothetical protein